MRSVWIIAKKELKTFLYSPIAYILTAFFLLVGGFFFYNILAWANEQTMRMMQSGYPIDRVNINQMLFEPFFNNMTVILMFLLPLLTMRLFADEKKMRTEELLLTSPLRLSSIILGKYLAALIVYAVILLLTATYAVFALRLRQSGAGTAADRLPRPVPARGGLHRHRPLRLGADREPGHRRGHLLLGHPADLGALLGR